MKENREKERLLFSNEGAVLHSFTIIIVVVVVRVIVPKKKRQRLRWELKGFNEPTFFVAPAADHIISTAAKV